MATIKVKRGSGYADMIRAYSIVLDGRQVGTLRRGQEIVLHAAAGAHTLQMKIDWCSSNPVSFSIAEEQSKSFECGNSTRAILALLYVILWPSDYLWLRPVP
jgi:hypothetical protein